jgi:beta-lactamase superfamily II metal-dependent hydrolase
MNIKPLLLGILVSGILPICPAGAQTAPAGLELGKPLPAWSEGELDIHHINTGRGEASFLIFPDGTNLLVDTSGKTVEAPPFSLPTRPDASRPPGEWVARYIQRLLPASTQKIDYALLSHFHGDHMGAIVEDSPRSRDGDYQLSGITEIAEHLPIATIIDRDWPDYDYPAPLDNRTVRNYRAFLDWQAEHRGLRAEQFQPGRNDQLELLHRPGAYPQFEVRNLMANGVVWTGVGSETRSLFPPIESLSPDDYPIENKLSIAFRVSYGKFDYFTGGDLSASDDETLSPAEAWKNVETPVAQATGPIDAMKANHHGSWDANSAAFLGVLRPRVIVVGSRAEGHPAVNTYKRMTSQATWPGPRDIFVTNVSPATFRTTYNIDKAASTQGHVVIRVAVGGASYRVFVLDDSNEDMRVKAVFGPYASN